MSHRLSRSSANHSVLIYYFKEIQRGTLIESFRNSYRVSTELNIKKVRLFKALEGHNARIYKAQATKNFLSLNKNMSHDKKKFVTRQNIFVTQQKRLSLDKKMLSLDKKMLSLDKKMLSLDEKCCHSTKNVVTRRKMLSLYK